jgi:hypothetical protein
VRAATQASVSHATSSAPPVGSLAPAPMPSETVERPEPGLARGRWEAPGWFFYAVAVAAILGGLTWIAAALRARRKAASR